MASLRSTARIARPADEVWKTMSDAAGISAWFPGIEKATAADGSRSCTQVVYSTEISPDSLAELMGPSIEGGVQGLKARLEGGSRAS